MYRAAWKTAGKAVGLPTSLAAVLLAGVLTASAHPYQKAAATVPAAASAVDNLTGTIDSILADPRLDGAQAAVLVRTADTGAVLYARNPDERLLPASNTKLFTSTAALDLLGPDHRFTTSVLATGAQHGTVLQGNIYLRGTGDPTLLYPDYDELAAKVATSGVRSVQGDLVADDTWFDNVRYGTSWAWDDEDQYYDAGISALSAAGDTDYDAGTVIVEAFPAASAGQPATVTLTPQTGYVKVVNRSTTVPAGGTDTLSIHRDHGTNNIIIDGTVPVGGSSTKEWVAVWEPTGYAADLFRRALAAHGVHVTGATLPGLATPATARPLASHDSMTLAEIYTPFLKLSNNMHAEILTKTLGRVEAGEGSWDAGLQVIADDMKAKFGVDMTKLRQADGSGLSRWDNIAPQQITDVLIAAQSKPWFQTWYNALPIAGNPDRMIGGTLRNRMRNTPAANNVHGKTGSLTGATALSGYVTDADGQRLVFSILFNNYLSGAPTDLQDKIAIVLATFSQHPTAAAPMVVPTVPVPTGPDLEWTKG
ncbi:MAG: D-alanyl-D-alanine carboxypeptidase/D-alanyl-D-alanine-endopeptidase [Micromonosporaceae bacterium]|nr:D-alanyl-D-alanine carboxypeptidase/D-alanyl-D-alanine-endopeptidase [Micromonosporaceae bacterium]